jgi:hypothetical protein
MLEIVIICVVLVCLDVHGGESFVFAKVVNEIVFRMNQSLFKLIGIGFKGFLSCFEFGDSGFYFLKRYGLFALS